ncbi:Chromosome partitioning ATPase, Mrp family, contains Fe-S cluster [Ruminococcaceae bacterium YRB3002]|nr:Chromosome partitioning ATPase, Mrp family, contains Fe-S cluster [Ruminococcaceae bacterium YRB3002]
MSSVCDSCPSKSGCTSQDSCPSLNKNTNDNIKLVIGVASGKGGVGKSYVTSVLASKLSSMGYKVGIMDADVTGPSIPKAFGLKGTLYANEEQKMVPMETKGGIKVVSLNLLLPDEETPVIWRGPVISGLVQQFWTDVDWGMLDVLLIDMPPGTGDVPLTVFQTVRIDGIVLVSTPQDLVSMIVAKARNMAQQMNVNILGIVDNMSYIKCPHCDEKIYLFGDDKSLNEAAAKAGLNILDTLPLDPGSTAKVDDGKAEEIGDGILDVTAGIIEGMLG